MSDSDSNDEEYNPTKNDEKIFEKEMKKQTIQSEPDKKSGMTPQESERAEEILRSFKLNQPIKPKSTEKKIDQAPKQIETYDFAHYRIDRNPKMFLNGILLPSHEK